MATTTTLHESAKTGDETAVRQFLVPAANLDSEDSKGRTPLSWAAENGHEAIVDLLLRKNADVNFKDSAGRTPLSWAAENGREDVVDLLLNKNADVNFKDSAGRTPLSWAAENGNYGILDNMLLFWHADVKSVDSRGRTPLSWAAEKGHKAAVKYLLSVYAEKDFGDLNRRTPLSWAAENGHEDVVDLLLEEGVDVNSVDSHGRTPLLWAAHKGYEAVVKHLLEWGAEKNLKDRGCRTPLSWAAENGHQAVVELLLEWDADMDSEDSSGRTPRLWAVRQGHKALVKLLRNRPCHVGDHLGLEPPPGLGDPGRMTVFRKIFGLVPSVRWLLNITCARSNFEVTRSRFRMESYVAAADSQGRHIIVGIMNRKTGIPRERLVFCAKVDIFEDIRLAHHLIRPWWRRAFSLKHVAGFSMYECHPHKGYHTSVDLDQRTIRTLSQLYGEYKTLSKDKDKRWEDWIQVHFNLSDPNPRKGKYTLELILRWSIVKITLYGMAPILLSLVIGFWYMTTPGDDRNAIVQTAWTISSYIITGGGGE
jgi:ankyrin repeat protein